MGRGGGERGEGGGLLKIPPCAGGARRAGLRCAVSAPQCAERGAPQACSARCWAPPAPAACCWVSAPAAISRQGRAIATSSRQPASGGGRLRGWGCAVGARPGALLYPSPQQPPDLCPRGSRSGDLFGVGLGNRAACVGVLLGVRVLVAVSVCSWMRVRARALYPLGRGLCSNPIVCGQARRF